MTKRPGKVLAKSTGRRVIRTNNNTPPIQPAKFNAYPVGCKVRHKLLKRDAIIVKRNDKIRFYTINVIPNNMWDRLWNFILFPDLVHSITQSHIMDYEIEPLDEMVRAIYKD